MKKRMFVQAAFGLALGLGVSAATAPAALAQTASTTGNQPSTTATQPPTNGTIPPAGATNQAATEAAGGPKSGANSFTEGQAQSRITDAGYTSVSGLKKDNEGVWHGMAMKNGQQVNVWLDYTGHVGQS